MSPNRLLFAEGAVYQGTQPNAFVAVPLHGSFEPEHGKPQPPCLPLLCDRLDWTPDQQRLAAAVLGDQARELMVLTRTVSAIWRRDGSEFSDYVRGMHWESERMAISLAKDAWHYASLALDAEEQAAQSIDGVVR